MEHKYEHDIRRKIHEAENNDVSWNKGEVWSRINQGTASRKSVWPYYAAASLALIVIAGIYSWTMVQNQSFEIRMRSLELAIEKEKSKFSLKEMVTAEDVCPEVVQENLAARNQKQYYRKPEHNVVASTAPQDTSLILTTPTIASVEPAVIVVQESTEEVQAEFTPTVITILPKPKETEITSIKARKFRIKLFRKQVPEPFERNDNSDEIQFALIH